MCKNSPFNEITHTTAICSMGNFVKRGWFISTKIPLPHNKQSIGTYARKDRTYFNAFFNKNSRL